MARRRIKISPATKMTIAVCILSYFVLLPYIAWSISSRSSFSFSNNPYSASPATTEKLLPIIDLVYAAEDAHLAGRQEAALRSLRSAFTNFQSQFPDGPDEAIHVLSSYLLGREADNLALASQPNESKAKAKSNQLGQLWYDVAKEVFGPRHIYTLKILQSFSVRLFNQGQLDKSMELHLVLIKILRKQINIASQPASDSDGETTVDKNSDRQSLSLLLIRILDNVRTFHLNNKQWKKALEVSKEMYELYKSHIGPSDKATQGILEMVVKMYEFMQLQKLGEQQSHFLPQVTQVFHPDLPGMTTEESGAIETAYANADQMTKPVATLAFYAYLQLLNVNQAQTETENEFDAGPTPLKYDEEVYELCFVILRLLRSSTGLRGLEPEYEEYRQTLAEMKGDHYHYHGNNNDDDDENAGIKWPAGFMENFDHTFAEAQRDDALERAKDLLERIAVKFGKTDRKTKGVAEIIQSLYIDVEMMEEAEEVRKRFELSSVNIEEELRETTKDEL